MATRLNQNMTKYGGCIAFATAELEKFIIGSCLLIVWDGPVTSRGSWLNLLLFTEICATVHAMTHSNHSLVYTFSEAGGMPIVQVLLCFRERFTVSLKRCGVVVGLPRQLSGLTD